jgi:hypothetical protein
MIKMKLLYSIVIIMSVAQHDFQFNVIQEEWVAKNSQRIKLPNKELITDLGKPRYNEREIAQEKLEKMGKSAWRYLIWGVYSSDSEIAQRSQSLLEKVLICEACEGTGNTMKKHKSDTLEDSFLSSFPCLVCAGTGKIYIIKERILNGTSGWQ